MAEAHNLQLAIRNFIASVDLPQHPAGMLQADRIATCEIGIHRKFDLLLICHLKFLIPVLRQGDKVTR